MYINIRLILLIIYRQYTCIYYIYIHIYIYIYLQYIDIQYMYYIHIHLDTVCMYSAYTVKYSMYVQWIIYIRIYIYIHMYIYIHISLYIYTHDTFPSNTQTIQWRSRDDMQPGTTIWTAFARVDARICEETEKCGVWQPRWVLMHQGQRCLLGFDMNHVGTILNSLNFQLVFMAFLSNCFCSSTRNSICTGPLVLVPSGKRQSC